jgi:SAM-dependent methyltransferase
MSDALQRLGSPPALKRRYAKLCDVQDFSAPAFRARAADIRPDLDLGWAFDRKTWEFTMLSLLLEECGLLDRRARVLSVGAGREAIIYWLAPRVGRIVAVDRYGTGRWRSVHARMLTDPASLSPYPGLSLDHLEVRAMDARSLEFADGSFDAVFSLSSIEHFGSPTQIRQAAAEIGRVMRPGGIAYLATELELRSPPRLRRAFQAASRALSAGRLGRAEVFSRQTLEEDVIGPSGLMLLQPLDLHISASSFENLAVRRLGRWLKTPSGRFHPHIVLRSGGRTFTSVGLPLWRPATAGGDAPP